MLRLLGRRIDDGSGARDRDLSRRRSWTPFHPLASGARRGRRWPDGRSAFGSSRSLPTAVAELAEPYGADAVELYRDDRRQPVLRHRGARRRRGRDPADGARCGARARCSAQRAGRGAARGRCRRSTTCRAVRCSRQSPRTTLGSLDECLASGMLVSGSRELFPSDTSLRASSIEEAIPPDRTLALHRACPGGAVGVAGCCRPRAAGASCGRGPSNPKAVLRFAIRARLERASITRRAHRRPRRRRGEPCALPMRCRSKSAPALASASIVRVLPRRAGRGGARGNGRGDCVLPRARPADAGGGVPALARADSPQPRPSSPRGRGRPRRRSRCSGSFRPVTSSRCRTGHAPL